MAAARRSTGARAKSLLTQRDVGSSWSPSGLTFRTVTARRSCCAFRGAPYPTKCFADSGHAGTLPATATVIAAEIVKKPPNQVGFAVPSMSVVRRALLRLDKAQPPPLEGPDSHARIRPNFPLPRLCDDPRQGDWLASHELQGL